MLALGETRLELPYPHVAGNYIGWASAAQGENANLPLAKALIMNRINNLVIHVDGDEVAVCYDRDKVRLIRTFIDDRIRTLAQGSVFRCIDLEHLRPTS
jgi:hypothetical protein